MPYLRIQTNMTVDSGVGDDLAAAASTTVAGKLGKSEDYMMVALESGVRMLFAGSKEPLAFLELKSIGLVAEQTEMLSAALCGLIENRLHIPQERIYINFSSVERKMWGWKGGTL
tara:strand:+ start:340 stop:684 length:345 start_codon:yes stop_codon:yes gene_type:complete